MPCNGFCGLLGLYILSDYISPSGLLNLYSCICMDSMTCTVFHGWLHFIQFDFQQSRFLAAEHGILVGRFGHLPRFCWFYYQLRWAPTITTARGICLYLIFICMGFMMHFLRFQIFFPCFLTSLLYWMGSVITNLAAFGRGMMMLACMH
ncbi:hypothetical protein GQ43DRAFT_293097 [Delitschia confertaspora ATCC 74209]|uniref:Uncharacterized protein n=1 Tax=Delitschia confertaspora ATCC 74209 TaxID=1513339 RepID=A0A9P4JTJ2_9PLEO|nr:hypothetical protein GQ43DRAFT_293097 [Delitschia confertaspora ATCC 74209]